MRIAHPTQARFDCQPITRIELNLQCRDEIVPILVALKHVYSQADMRDELLRCIAKDVNADSSPNRGREGLGYWQILVLAAVRLGCNFDYDRLQDLAENHRTLRHMMGMGDWNETLSLPGQRIRDNICLLKAETITQIYQAIVQEGHRLNPQAARTARVDSFVMETNIHYPTESSLIWDGLRKVIELCSRAAIDFGLSGWRQSAHLLKKVKQLHREISHVSSSKKPNKKKTLKRLYGKLLKRAQTLLARAEQLVLIAEQVSPAGYVQAQQIRVFIERTRHVAGTAHRRVILGEKVPNEDKVFSIFEPHTQLYRRGKAGQENQFGRLVMIYEDGVGFITHHYLLGRDETDAQTAVPQTTIVQERLGGALETISFDRGFYSEENDRALHAIVAAPCLPQRAPAGYQQQMKSAPITFRSARQRHPGVESAIGALQSGNGMKRSRDRGELGYERYLCLAILGRNLQTLGKQLIAARSPDSKAAYSRRQQVA